MSSTFFRLTPGVNNANLGTSGVPVGVTSTRVLLPERGDTLQVHNLSVKVLYIMIGDEDVTVSTANGFPCFPGTVYNFDRRYVPFNGQSALRATHIAGICGTDDVAFAKITVADQKVK